MGLIVISILTVAALTYLILKFSPSARFLILNYQFPVIALFLALLFIFLFSLSAFILTSTRRGVLIGLFAVIYLILRLNNLTHPFFLIMLLILFACVELLFAKRK